MRIAFPRNIALAIALLGVGLALNACAATEAPAIINEEEAAFSAGTAIDPPRTLSDFTLPSTVSPTLSLSDLRGKVVLLYFGYTFCPDICPTTLAELVHVKRMLDADADNAAFVLISVDPDRDTPGVLTRYLAAFDPDFIGMSGDDQTLRAIGSDYGLYYERRADLATSADYLVDHSSATYLIDQEGQLRMVYSYGTPPEVIGADVQDLLR